MNREHLGSETIDTPCILIVDDDPGQRSLLNSFLSKQGFSIVLADSGERALEILAAENVDMLISDVRMPGLSGLETLRRARKRRSSLPVLMVTAYADIREAVGAMRDGAINYLAKPIDLDELLASVQEAFGMVKQGVNPASDKQLPLNVVAESPVMQAVFRDASLIAESDVHVLITGESGVGKEILADVIHAWSKRSSGPLVKVNCAAIPDTLLESELFGHEKGAFTGAHMQRIGRFEEASSGTILLDEIAEMSPQLQAKLLRVTQSGHFQRIGSNREIDSNARILAASNRNLEEEIENGRFRKDLYYRLNVVDLNIPPLRERKEDIMPLAGLFIKGLTGGRARFAGPVADCLKNYFWPGNVRELRNVIERAVLLSGGELIMLDHLPSRIRDARNESDIPGNVESQKLDDVERDTILQTLRKHEFNRTAAAKALGVSRRTLTYKLQRFQKLGYAIDPVA